MLDVAVEESSFEVLAQVIAHEERPIVAQRVGNETARVAGRRRLRGRAVPGPDPDNIQAQVGDAVVEVSACKPARLELRSLFDRALAEMEARLPVALRLRDVG